MRSFFSLASQNLWFTQSIIVVAGAVVNGVELGRPCCLRGSGDSDPLCSMMYVVIVVVMITIEDMGTIRLWNRFYKQ